MSAGRRAASRRASIRAVASVPPRLAGPPEWVNVLTRDDVMKAFQAWAGQEMGYDDSQLPGKSRNFHWIMLPERSSHRGAAGEDAASWTRSLARVKAPRFVKVSWAAR